jgi:hypothetical protein
LIGKAKDCRQPIPNRKVARRGPIKRSFPFPH